MQKPKDRCPCGDIILADAEDWPVPLCYECYPKHLVDALEIAVKALNWYSDHEGNTQVDKFKPLKTGGVKVSASVIKTNKMAKKALRQISELMNEKT